MNQGYFFVADILGFRNIVANLKPEGLSGSIANWISVVKRCKELSGIEKHQLISDTVFASADSTEAGLKSMISFARNLLTLGIDASFPVRGAIEHGDIEWGEVTHGNAVIRAHAMESNQDWIGVTCDSNLPHIEAVWGYDSLVRYQSPLKSGGTRNAPVVVWDIPDSSRLHRLINSRQLVEPTRQMKRATSSKFDNTLQFKIYLKLLKEVGRDPREFEVLSPMHLTHMYVFGESVGCEIDDDGQLSKESFGFGELDPKLTLKKVKRRIGD